MPSSHEAPTRRSTPPPRLRRSIATVSLSGTLEEKLAAAARAGFDGVEIFENDLIACPLGVPAIRSLAADLGLEVMLYQPFRDFEAVPDERLAGNLRRAEHKFQVMTSLGASTLLVCSNTSAAAIDNDALAAAQLRQLAERASAHGIRVAFEALAWGRHISSFAHAWQVVSAAAHPSLGLCLDSFHIFSLGDDSAPVRGIPGEKIFFLQLADAPLLGMDIVPWSRHYRCFPGQGGFDLTGFTADVLASGYDGPWSLEVFNDIFRQADAARTARDGMRSLLLLEGAVAAGPGRQPPHPGPVRLAELPAPVDLSGYAFVELAVDPLMAQVAASVLTGLGFTCAGHHRTKAVDLWTQAGARLVVNRSGLDDSGRARTGAPADAAVAAIAVENTDPDRSARRAQALLAPPLPRAHGPGEADFTAVAAPDGSSVFFCQTGTGRPAGWLSDFHPPRARHSQIPPLITGVDHVALSQPFDGFDEATLFYKSVFGMREQGSEEVASPYGLVRSRAMRSSDGTVRLILNVPLLGAARLPETAAYQHVAFACPDIFRAARAVRSHGTPMLPVPGNYYGDLTARFGLDGEFLDMLREHGVLYDRDGHGGEFFHFYTVTIGRRLFFEVVQRRGGYEGYGAPNTAVRLAAQLRYAAAAGIDTG